MVTDTNIPGKLQYGYWFPQEFTSVIKQTYIKLGKSTLFLLRLQSSTYKENIKLQSLNLKYKQALSNPIQIPNPHKSWQDQSITAQKMYLLATDFLNIHNILNQKENVFRMCSQHRFTNCGKFFFLVTLY
jgi:hypothetical protein